MESQLELGGVAEVMIKAGLQSQVQDLGHVNVDKWRQGCSILGNHSDSSWHLRFQLYDL